MNVRLLLKRLLYVVLCTILGYLVGHLTVGKDIPFALAGCVAGIVVEIINGGNKARVFAVLSWILGTAAGALVATFSGGSGQAATQLRWESILGFGAMFVAAIVTRFIVGREIPKTAEQLEEDKRFEHGLRLNDYK
jgi:hypothetical protein